MLELAVAVNVPVANRGPAMFNVELAALVHVEPLTEPVMPPAADVVTVPLFVTVIVPLMAMVPENARFADERTVCAALIVSVAVFVIDPVPSIFVLAPLRVMAPVPLSVPFTTELPATPNVKVEVLSVAPLVTVRSPDNVVLPASVAPLELLILR